MPTRAHLETRWLRSAPHALLPLTAHSRTGRQILEYFPDKLVANDLTREQEKFVMAALGSTQQNIDLFLELMPPAAVDKAKAQIDEENRLNEVEYGEVNDDPILNIAPKKA